MNYKNLIIFNLIFLSIFVVCFIISVLSTILTIYSIPDSLNQRGLWVQFGIAASVISLALITLVINQWYNDYKEEKERIFHLESQKQLLKTLDIFRLKVFSVANAHRKQLNMKKPVIPSYFLPTFNSFSSAYNIDSKILGKNTTTFKLLLLEFQLKIDTINRLIELIQNAEINGNRKKENEIIKELKNNTYYEDLFKIVNDQEWQEWLKFVVRKFNPFSRNPQKSP